MDSRHRRCGRHCPEIRGLIEHGRSEKHKGKLDKFGGLYGNPSYGQGQLCAEAFISSRIYGKENQDPHPCIQPLKLIKLPYPFHDIRNGPGQACGNHHDDILAHRLIQPLIQGQPG